MLRMLLGAGIPSHGQGALGGQGWHGRKDRGVLRRRNRGRKRGRQGGEVRRGAGVDGAVGADDRLNTGHPVYRPEEGKKYSLKEVGR